MEGAQLRDLEIQQEIWGVQGEAQMQQKGRESWSQGFLLLMITSCFKTYQEILKYYGCAALWL